MSYSSVYTTLPGAMNRRIKGRIVACGTCASIRRITAPLRRIMPKIGGFSFSSVPRPGSPFNRRPAARQFRRSLYRYAAGPEFHPMQELPASWLKEAFADPDRR